MSAWLWAALIVAFLVGAEAGGWYQLYRLRRDGWLRTERNFGSARRGEGE